MTTLILEPEFFIDYDLNIHTKPITIKNGRVLPPGSKISDSGTKRIILKNQVLMPGFVNCHSHAFQRGLRGLVEKTNVNNNDFWTWRQNMYKLASQIDLDTFEAIATLLYIEMLEAGFTNVGEFHYLHHDTNGQSFSDPLILSKKLKNAAKKVGINLCLLECAYNRQSFGESLQGAQKRFAFEDVDTFLEMVKQARQDLSSTSCSVGLAIHSIRSVPPSWYEKIGQFSANCLAPLHIHASEQVEEVRLCKKSYGHSPISLLDENHLLTPSTTLVHATHLIDSDIDLIRNKKPNICLCPSTEKNLGDGVIPLNELTAHGVKICLGTDQHVRVDPFHEAQSLEEQERLRLKKRIVLNAGGKWLHQALLPALNLNGMASLYPSVLKGGNFNDLANLISIDLPPEYEWHGPRYALDSIMLSHHAAKINTVISDGHIVVHEHKSLYRDKKHLIKQIQTFFSRFF